MQKFVRIIDGIFSTVITLFLGAMLALVFLNVVLRYGFNSGITESEELARYFFVWVVFLGAIIAHKEKGHLGVDLLIGALPAKLQKVMYVIVNAIVIAVLVIIINGSIKMAIINSNSYSPATGIPMSVLFFAAILAGVCMIIISVVHTIQYVFLNTNHPVWAKDRKDGDE